MLTVDLSATRDLHQQLLDCWQSAPDNFRELGLRARQELADKRVKFEGTRNMSFAISALTIDAVGNQALREVAETLHSIVERALEWVCSDQDRLDKFFPDHRRIFPYLVKTPGLASWQGYSRYDAVICRDGRIEIIELNTACPAGFMHSQHFAQLTEQALQSLGVNGGRHVDGGIAPGVLVDGLLHIEREAGLAPQLVALLNDENQLQNELDLIADEFDRRGREAAVISAADLQYAPGCLAWRDQPISLTYNKIRISTAQSPNHCWADGFEKRYAAFLQAIRDRAVISVNNLCAITLAEDKGMLALIRNPQFQQQLSAPERDFVDAHVLWTERMQAGRVTVHGASTDLLPYVRDHQEGLVIKPANEGRGFGVVVGKYCSRDEWLAACEPNPQLPCVVQEFAESATLPVVHGRNDEVCCTPMFVSVGLAVVEGTYQGLLSRASPDPITNVGRQGMIQAVFVSES